MITVPQTVRISLEDAHQGSNVCVTRGHELPAEEKFLIRHDAMICEICPYPSKVVVVVLVLQSSDTFLDTTP